MSSYLFIDGAYLREAFGEAMRDFFGEIPEINFHALGEVLAHHHRTYYYDAVDRSLQGNETEQHRKDRVAARDALHAYLNTLPLWHVREGFVSRGRRVSRRSQKAVDVQLAVDALEHAVARNMTHATFVLGDLDFEPLFFSLNRFGIETTVYYERESASLELLEAADVRRQLSLHDFWKMTAHDFRRNHVAPAFGSGGDRPDTSVILRQGIWEDRSIAMLRLTPAERHLYVWTTAGLDPLRQPAIQCSYSGPDGERLVEKAFLMQYGGSITWQP